MTGRERILCESGSTVGFDAATGQADLDYVLRWLKQTDAPENIVGLQKRGADTFERLSKALETLAQWPLEKTRFEAERFARSALEPPL